MARLRDDDDTDDLKTLFANCAECQYYGYSMSLWCLCGRGDDPHVYSPRTLELRELSPKPFIYQLANES